MKLNVLNLYTFDKKELLLVLLKKIKYLLYKINKTIRKDKSNSRR